MQTISQLMGSVGCTVYPKRWSEFYNHVMNQYDLYGCIYSKADYYDTLNQKYGVCMMHLKVYKEAAQEVEKCDELNRVLALWCYAIHDREHFGQDLQEMSEPTPSERITELACNMLPGLAMCSYIPQLYKLLEKRKIPGRCIEEILSFCDDAVSEHMRRHEGKPGFQFFGWYQLSLDQKLYSIGRLQYEIFTSFRGNAVVFEDGNNEQVALAYEAQLHKSGFALGSRNCIEKEGAWIGTITETDDYWEGYPYREDGTVSDDKIRLLKTDWKIVLSKGDEVISIHIPPKDKFTADVIDKSLFQATQFFRDYFPDYKYKAFVCFSWMMDPKLKDLLGEESNIVKFGSRFKKISCQSMAEDVFKFVFLKEKKDIAISELPETTRLQRLIKEHYQNGKVIYEMLGYFFEA